MHEIGHVILEVVRLLLLPSDVSHAWGVSHSLIVSHTLYSISVKADAQLYLFSLLIKFSGF